jgi:hypothetical protein
MNGTRQRDWSVYPVWINVSGYLGVSLNIRMV